MRILVYKRFGSRFRFQSSPRVAMECVCPKKKKISISILARIDTNINLYCPTRNPKRVDIIEKIKSQRKQHILASEKNSNDSYTGRLTFYIYLYP